MAMASTRISRSCVATTSAQHASIPSDTLLEIVYATASFRCLMQSERVLFPRVHGPISTQPRGSCTDMTQGCMPNIPLGSLELSF